MNKSDYFEKLKDPRWQRKRLCVMERDQFKCRDCGSESKTLHVHHLAYQGKNPWDAGDDVLLTLCNECHEQRHEVEHDLQLSLARIMARLSPTELRGLLLSALKLVEDGCEEPSIRCAIESDYMEDARWHFYAQDHREFIGAYEAVTRNKFERKGVA